MNFWLCSKGMRFKAHVYARMHVGTSMCAGMYVAVFVYVFCIYASLFRVIVFSISLRAR